MGRLIIDGNSVFEIDEECIKRKQIPKDCDIEKYLPKKNHQNVRTEKESKHKK